MSQPFLGQIMTVGFTFAPTGWAFCNGQLLSIAQNSALFALLGTTYGGDGETTFALPNLQGRVPRGAGIGQGLSQVNAGEVGGQETMSEPPPHTHVLPASSGLESTDQPAGAVPAQGGAYDVAGNANVALAPSGTTSGSQSDPSVLDPYLGMYYIIALEGIFPSQS